MMGVVKMPYGFNDDKSKYELDNYLKTIEGDGTGDAVLLGAGGLTVVGGGEAANNLYADLGKDPKIEELHLASDNTVNIHSACNTVANRKTWTLANEGSWQFTGSNIDIDTAPSSRKIMNLQRYYDKNGNQIAQVAIDQSTAGRVNFLLGGRRGSVYNQLGLGVEADGTPAVYLDSPAAWRKALGLSYAKGTSLTFSGVATACSGWITSSQTAVSFLIPLSKPIESDVSSVTLSGNISIRTNGAYLRAKSAPTVTDIPITGSAITYKAQIHPAGVFVITNNATSSDKWVTDNAGATVATNNDALSVALASGFKLTFA